MIAGYGNQLYAQSLSEWGRPRELPQCNGWILERIIPGFSQVDAMGCYPLFSCQNWSKLKDDLDALESDLVSLALVTDPFGDYDANYLKRCFPDVVIPFKTHFVVDLTKHQNQIGKNRQRKHALNALKKVQIQVCKDPRNFVESWSMLYHNLIIQSQIEDIRAFSRLSFTKQFKVPGIVTLTAKYEGKIIGAHVYFLIDDVVHRHLGVIHPIGYEVGATYAMDCFSIEYFANQANWLDLGGGAGYF